MTEYDVNRFNQEMRRRTVRFAVGVFRVLKDSRLTDLSRIPARQLLKSATSVAANYSSATRGRSEAEFYSKICVVTEECDESLFWINFLEEVEVLTEPDAVSIKREAEELLRIFSSIKKKLKLKRR
jgi:four helix bundle protein